MESYFRPPTKRMIEKLKECWEKESSQGERFPCLPDDMKSSLSGWAQRGFIGTKMDLVNGKKIMCIYVTDSGKRFLEEYNNRRK